MSHHPARVALSIGCVGLAAFVYREIDRPGAELHAATAPVGQLEAPSLPPSEPAALLPLEAYNEISERPLFASTRRAATLVRATVTHAPSRVTLIGVAVSKEVRRAILEHGSPARREVVGEGAIVSGWTVESVSSDRVVVSQDGTRQELRIKDSPPQSAGTSAAAPSRQR
jgi:hypothetical protein